MQRPRDTAPAGVAFALGAYGLWGLLPLYFILLDPAGPFEIVAWRIVFSLIFCAVLLTAVRGWAKARTIVADRRLLGTLALGAVLLTVNWTVFVIATNTDQVVEASLGYFINPLISVVLGVVFLRERLRPLQWAAVGVSAVAVVVLIVGHGTFPWIALVLAGSFGLYGLVKNRTGGRVDAISGLTIETAVLTPVAAAVLVGIGFGVPVLSLGDDGLEIAAHGPWYALLMSLLGVVTALPLLFFAAAARRIPLSWVGLTQFLAPVLQFILGVVVLHEPMPPERWAGFVIVWVALALLVIDMLGSARRRKRTQDNGIVT